MLTPSTSKVTMTSIYIIVTDMPIHAEAILITLAALTGAAAICWALVKLKIMPEIEEE